MKTVWVTQYINQQSSQSPQSQHVRRFARAACVDIKIRSIKQLPAHLSKLAL
jgi:hypothetical protein